MNREYLAIGVALVVLSLLMMIIRKEKYTANDLVGKVYFNALNNGVFFKTNTSYIYFFQGQAPNDYGIAQYTYSVNTRTKTIISPNFGVLNNYLIASPSPIFLTKPAAFTFTVNPQPTIQQNQRNLIITFNINPPKFSVFIGNTLIGKTNMNNRVTTLQIPVNIQGQVNIDFRLTNENIFRFPFTITGAVPPPPPPPIPRPPSLFPVTTPVPTPTPRPGTSGPAPRPGTSGPAPRPNPMLIPGWSLVKSRRLLKYTIIGDGIQDEDSSAWRIGDENEAARQANIIGGCTAFVIDRTNATTRYILKSPNFSRADNFETKYNQHLSNNDQNYVTYFRILGVDDPLVNAAVRAQVGFKNADPSVIIHNGVYLYTYADSSGVLYVASDYDIVNRGLPTTVQPMRGITENIFAHSVELCSLVDIKLSTFATNCVKPKASLWAPEIVNINGVIYIFFSFFTNADVSTIFYMYNDNPARFGYIDGWVIDHVPLFGKKVASNWANMSTASTSSVSTLTFNWFIDPAVEQINGRWYISAGTNVPKTPSSDSPKRVEQRLIIQEMQIGTTIPIPNTQFTGRLRNNVNPTRKITLLGNPLVMKSSTDYRWEYNGSHIMYPGVINSTQNNFPVEEGPFFLQTATSLYLLFNANFSMHPGYCIGVYKCRNKNGNILDLNNWEKFDKPIFFSTPASHPGNIYGSGAPSIVRNNNDYFMFYHASPEIAQYEKRIIFVQRIIPENIENYRSLGGSVYRLNSGTTVTAGTYLGAGYRC
jgi:hypothetical protein